MRITYELRFATAIDDVRGAYVRPTDFVLGNVLFVPFFNTIRRRWKKKIVFGFAGGRAVRFNRTGRIQYDARINRLIGICKLIEKKILRDTITRVPVTSYTTMCGRVQLENMNYYFDYFHFFLWRGGRRKKN